MLRAIDEQDLEPMRQWRNSPTLQKYFRQWKNLTAYDQAKWYEETLTGTDRIMFAIWNDGQMVGCCGLTQINWKDRNAEVSIYLGDPKVGGLPVYIDEKVAPLALKDLLEYAFKTCAMHRVWVDVFAYDTKKAKLFENAGFKTEGVLRSNYFKLGEWVDSTIYGLLETEWRSA